MKYVTVAVGLTIANILFEWLIGRYDWSRAADVSFSQMTAIAIVWFVTKVEKR